MPVQDTPQQPEPLTQPNGPLQINQPEDADNDTGFNVSQEARGGS